MYWQTSARPGYKSPFWNRNAHLENLKKAWLKRDSNNKPTPESYQTYKSNPAWTELPFFFKWKMRNFNYKRFFIWTMCGDLKKFPSYSLFYFSEIRFLLILVVKSERWCRTTVLPGHSTARAKCDKIFVNWSLIQCFHLLLLPTYYWTVFSKTAKLNLVIHGRHI